MRVCKRDVEAVQKEDVEYFLSSLRDILSEVKSGIIRNFRQDIYELKNVNINGEIFRRSELRDFYTSGRLTRTIIAQFFS